MLTTEKILSAKVWYQLFREWTYDTVILDVPHDVEEYLQSDGTMVLPEEAELSGSKIRRYRNEYEEEWCTDDCEESGKELADLLNQDGDNSSDEDDSDSLSAVTQPTFPVFSSKIAEAINNLGGSVFIKLDRVAPKDACIGLNGSLKCFTTGDVYLLLKSSKCITKALTEKAEQRQLLLRRWADIEPGREFRCFIREGKLTAICQRDIHNVYPHLAEQHLTIAAEISDFHASNVAPVFPLMEYSMDIVWSESPKIIDFNAWGEPGGSLLYSWTDIETMDGEVTPPLHYIVTEQDIPESQPIVEPHPTNFANGIPSDLTDEAIIKRILRK